MKNNGREARPDSMMASNLVKLPVYLSRGLKYHAAGRLYTPKPLNITFRVTRACNSRCVMCFDWSFPETVRELNPGEIETILSNSILSSVKKFTLSGGEPTLRDDLVEIADIALRSLPRLEELLLLTNGMDPDLVMGKITGLQSLPRWKKLHRFSVSVSLDGIGNTHEMIRRVPFAFERVDETIRRLQELSRSIPFYISLVCIVQPLNLLNIVQIAEYAQERSLPVTYVPVCLGKGFIPDANVGKELIFDSEHLQHLRTQFNHEIRSSLNPSNLPCWEEFFRIADGGRRTLPCHLRRHFAGLDADGTLYLCNVDDSLVYGSALETPVNQLWCSPQADEVRRRAERAFCPKCTMCCDTAFVFAHEFFYYARFFLKEKGRQLIG